ncbi:MAG TPA: DUF4097 family beta strand repeat-containing protein, partial [Anaerolineae bacterium]|nr:DUF4097 family beta strand repeat-containing protein [Anaerolineae bacterium]
MEPRNRNVIVVVVALVVLLCLCLAAAAVLVLANFVITDVRTSGPGISTEAEENRTFTVEPGAALRVDSFAGNVTVQAADEGHILVVATRRAGTSASRERIQVQYQETAGGLEIRTTRPVGLLNARVDFQIQVPPGTPLELDTGSGNVEVRGVTEGVRAETGSGNVTALGLAGDVELDTGSGNVDLQDVVGTVTVETGSGNLTLRGVEGDLAAHTGSGSIMVEGATGQARLDTGSGSVEYRGTPAGECRFETGSGSVVLYLPADLDARVDLQTNSGSVDVQFPVEGESTRQRVQGVIG